MAVYENPVAALAAECFGTFMLVLVGTGTVVLFAEVEGWVATTAISLAFGGVVWAMVGLFGPVSRAHINPAVTLGFWAARDISAPLAVGYWSVQLAGAAAASCLIAVLTSGGTQLGATVPAIPLLAAVVLEVALTCGLMGVILWVVNRPAASSWYAGAAIGGWVGVAALFAGGYTGASMNPARSFGPALFADALDPLWLYFLAPSAGALAAVTICRAGTERSGCCRQCAAWP